MFDEKLGRYYGGVLVFAEDYELCLRTHFSNKRIVYDPNIVVLHSIDSNRLSYHYILRRFLQLGVERRILDIKFMTVSNYNQYRPELLRFPRFVKSWLLGEKTMSNFLILLREMLLPLGYYFIYRAVVRDQK